MGDQNKGNDDNGTIKTGRYETKGDADKNYKGLQDRKATSSHADKVEGAIGHAKEIEADKKAMRDSVAEAGLPHGKEILKALNSGDDSLQQGINDLKRLSRQPGVTDSEKTYIRAVTGLLEDEKKAYGSVTIDKSLDVSEGVGLIKTGFMAHPDAAKVKVGYPRAVTTPDVDHGHAPAKPAVTASAPKASH